jgi:hypothetical protein
LDRFGSIDSEDTFLSCNTHPFPSQGSLAGLEELAALGSMAANGSMPAVNIPSFNNNATGYANPFDPSGTNFIINRPLFFGARTICQLGILATCHFVNLLLCKLDKYAFLSI